MTIFVFLTSCMKPTVLLTRLETTRPSNEPLRMRRLFHPRGQMKYCDFCPLKSLKKSAISAHIQTVHLKKVRFSCDVCNFKCFTRSGLKSHSAIHQNLTECKICFKWVTSMKRHLKYHALPNKTCKICGKMLSPASLSNHIKHVHLKLRRDRRRKTVKTWFCDLCSTTCKEKNRLITHMDRKHLRKRQYKCNLCDRLFFTTWDLQIHGGLHREATECKICNKKVRHMERHLKHTHLSQNSSCEICGKAMKAASLLHHIERIHNKVTLRAFWMRLLWKSYQKSTLIFSPFEKQSQQ